MHSRVGWTYTIGQHCQVRIITLLEQAGSSPSEQHALLLHLLVDTLASLWGGGGGGS